MSVSAAGPRLRCARVIRRNVPPLQERRSVNESRESLSVTAAATRLGVSRTTVWRMIAEGTLDAEHVIWNGRTVTRVLLPAAGTGASGELPPSRTARLQAQVDRLTQSVDRLSALLAESERQQMELVRDLRELSLRAGAARNALNGVVREEPVAHADLPQPRARPAIADRTIRADLLPPPGITARPNPMTHPVEVIARHIAHPSGPAPTREELLEPVRSLFTRERGGRTWWRRLPVGAR